MSKHASGTERQWSWGKITENTIATLVLLTVVLGTNVPQTPLAQSPTREPPRSPRSPGTPRTSRTSRTPTTHDTTIMEPGRRVPRKVPTPVPTPTAVPLLASVPPPVIPLPTPTPCITMGFASQYAVNVMEGTIRLRQGWGELPQDLSLYNGFVAVRNCTDIGKAYLIRRVGTEEWELFLAVDCASKTDRQSDTDPRSGWEWMRDGNLLCEVGHQTAVRWDVVDRGGVQVEMMSCRGQR